MTIYDSDNHQVESVAGALNSVFDLIGQNLERMELPSGNLNQRLQEFALRADPNTIYYCPTNGKFYFKDFQFTAEGADALDPTDPDDLRWIEQGFADIEFASTKENPTPGFDATIIYPYGADTLDLYTRYTTEEHYEHIKDNELQPEMTYHTLNLTGIVDANAAETTDEEFANLIGDAVNPGVLYWREDSSASTRLHLVLHNETHDDTKTYYKVEEISPNAIYNFFPRSSDSPFVTYDNQPLRDYPTAQLDDENNNILSAARAHIFFKRIVSDEATHPIDAYGNIDYSQTIYTTRLKAVAISRELSTMATDDLKNRLRNFGYDINGLPVIDK